MVELDRQYRAARDFDPDNFGAVQVVAGTYPDLADLFPGATHGTKNDLIEQVVSWVKN